MDSFDDLISFVYHLSVQIDSWILLGSVYDFCFEVDLSLDFVFGDEME